MTTISDIEHITIAKSDVHCLNQIAARKLKNGDILAVFNEERFPIHHDTGQTVITRSKDGGKTWSDYKVVYPWSDVEGNWDCGICEMADGALIVNFTVTAFFKRGMKHQQPSWAAGPLTKEWGDWTYSYKLRSWIGTYVVFSHDGGETWSDKAVACNVRPMKHAGCRLGCWQLPDGGLLMGLYGRMHGYEEEGEGESTRSFLIRSDDGGRNWEYYSTLAYDPANIIDYEEPGLVRLDDGKLVCFMRTHTNPASDAKNMVMVVSEDDGFSWTPPKWTNIWGFPPEIIRLQDGRYLMIYGYRKPPYGTRGCISLDGLNWDVKNEFIIREGGVPGASSIGKLSSSRGTSAGGHGGGVVNWEHPGIYQHIGYPSIVQAEDGTCVAMYHEWSDDEVPIQYVRATRFRV